MKKLRISILVLAFLCIFSGCADNHNDGSPTLLSQSTGTESYLYVYQDILDNNILMYDTDTDKKMYLCDYLNDTELSISKYSIIDLNGDNNPEMVVWLSRGTLSCATNENWSFLILRNFDDLVYAYELAYRTFFELKNDGTFMYSSSAQDYGVGKIDFINATYAIYKMAYSESVDSTQKTSYYIDDRSVSKEELEAYITKQNEKNSVAWQEYTYSTQLSRGY